MVVWMVLRIPWVVIWVEPLASTARGSQVVSSSCGAALAQLG